MELEVLGYLGAFLGAVLEGEVAILTALQSAHLGYTNFWGILTAALLGTLSMDWMIYFVGRNKGRYYLQKRKNLSIKLKKMEAYMIKYGDWLLIFYRFMYGFRIALPLLFGISSIPIRKFIFYSLLSTGIWLSILGIFGHYLANWIGI
jgi:membrane protein DedA with SNARE-associated domain